jgi:acetoin utilization protein AcuC
MNNLVIAYSDAYLNWKLGSGDGSHPTNPVRAKLAVDYLEAELPEIGVDYEIIEPTFEEGDRNRLLEVHSEHHVSRVLDTGTSAEWFGVSRSNAETAGLMFGGTVRLVEKMLSDGTRVAFNPQGAKHHAHYAKSSGFCVFNDMAWAALEFKKAGLKVAYIDWDVHAGDGVQALLSETDIPTFSIHGHGIFPNLYYTSIAGEKGDYLYMDEDKHWYNYNLEQGAGDESFAWAIDDTIRRVAEYAPDVILIATGADGHEGETWGIKYTLDGYKYAAEKVAELAKKLGSKVLIGGAGGYQPYTWTPRIWAEVVKTVGSTLLS